MGKKDLDCIHCQHHVLTCVLRNKFFVRAGAWCWISVDYESERLAFHYICTSNHLPHITLCKADRIRLTGVFLVQFGTVLIYIITFFMLRRKTKGLFKNAQQGANAPNMTTIQAVNRITMLMTLYPCFYVLLTLPLSAGRMWSMAHNGKPYSDAYACIAGAMITSCGWIDTLLYTLTRRRLLKDTMPQSTSRRTRSSNWDNDLGSKGITHTRTVTVEGGHVMDFPSPSGIRHGSMRMQNFGYERPPSPNGSMDPILSGHIPGGKHKAEVSVGLQEMLAEDPEKQDDVAPLPPGWVRQQEPSNQWPLVAQDDPSR